MTVFENQTVAQTLLYGIPNPQAIRNPARTELLGDRMRPLNALGLIAALAVTSAAPAAAQVTGPHSLIFLSGSGVGFNGWQVGTYHASLDGTPISIWCTDFYNHSANATVWESGLGGSNPDLSKTRWGSLTGQPALYQRAAALTTLFATNPTSEWGYIHYAIWQLMSDPTPTHAGVNATSQTKIDSYVAWSLANYTHYDYSQMFVLSDQTITGARGCQGIAARTTCGAQEYLTGTVTVTPEPAAVGLMATGLVGLSLMSAVRRRKKS